MTTKFTTNTAIAITPTSDASSSATFGLAGNLSVETSAEGDEAFFVRTFYPEFVNYDTVSGSDDAFKIGAFPGLADYGEPGNPPEKDWNGQALSLNTLKAIMIEVKPIKAFQGTAASGVLNFKLHPVDGNTVVIGGTTYTFKTAPNAAYHVFLGANKAAAQTNLDKAIDASGIAGTNYFAGTLRNPLISTSVIAGDTITVTAARTGLAGNLIATTASEITHTEWGAATLTGGLDVTQPAVARTLEGSVKITLASALLPGAGSSLIYEVTTPSLLTFAVPEGWTPDNAGMINIQFNSTGPAPLTDKDVNAVVTVALIGSST
jgi:hypothetical protein